MNESVIIKELSQMSKQGVLSSADIQRISSLLSDSCLKIQAKALWVLGEAGLRRPAGVADCISRIAAFLHSDTAKLRERSLNALGRIGRADFSLTEPYLADMLDLAKDPASEVRLAFIWACENIAVNTPYALCGNMPIFIGLLKDESVRVRIEAPEIFRVFGRRIPELVEPYLSLLSDISCNDENEIVRIHAKGAIKAIAKAG